MRDLAERYSEVASDPIQESRREAWRGLNSLEEIQPLIYVRAFAWKEMPESTCECEDPLLRSIEARLRQEIFRHTFDDDTVVEPWISVPAVHSLREKMLWGLPMEWAPGGENGGARQMRPCILEPEDAERMAEPTHCINEEASTRRMSLANEVLGDVLPLVLDRAPVYQIWNADISTNLTRFRGLDQVMLDMVERPEWLHKVLAFMRDGVLRVHKQAEEQGDWKLCDHQNQSMPYSRELDDPGPSEKPRVRNDLWCFVAAQEMTLIGPAQFEEFMLRYQIPIMEPFGLTAYGCCEDLTLKIPLLRRIPNLRRIAVSPMANMAKCAEQIGPDYVLSYRPSPSDMVGYSFGEDRIRRVLTRDLEACKANNCHIEISLKDVETVQNDPTRIPKWVEIAREVIDAVY
ncbi:hypothetical protein HQ520_17920 [bacterium]|nr:hypothetical protein [bacterium]